MAGLEAAHHDYSRPLEVRWLCPPCHRAWDSAQPKGGTVASQEALAASQVPILNTLRDRITGFRRVPASEILGSDFNFRTHGAAQQRAVEESLSLRGMYDAVITYRNAAGELRIADGHLRQSLINARVGPETPIPILETDLTEDEAKAVLLVHDPLSAMAGVDKGKLEQLMQVCAAAGQENAKLLESLAKQNEIDWTQIAANNPAITAGREPAKPRTGTPPTPHQCPHCGGEL
jgi:hypothetical protein